MKLDVLDLKGNKVETLELSKEVFGGRPNLELLAQYVRVYRANQRQGTSSTKTRAEVSGTGKKPWKQKGTGRARVSASRIPLWRHGGISHGPKPRDWSLDMPKKMKQLALVHAITKYLNDNNVKVLSALTLEAPKTKTISELKSTLELKGKTLLVTKNTTSTVLKSTQNLKNVTVSNVKTLNAYDVLSASNVLFIKDAMELIKGKYENK